MQQREPSYSISERLGRGHEISDTEFYTFLDGEEKYFISLIRRIQLSLLLRRKEWQDEIRRHQDAKAAASQFLTDRPYLANPDNLVPPPWMNESDLNPS